MAWGNNNADPWGGLREVTRPQDRSNVGRSSGGFSRDSGMSATSRGGISSGVRVASSTGGWFSGGQVASQSNYDPWAGLRSTNRPVTPVTYPRTPNVHQRNMALYRNAIANIESAGWKGRAYQAIGPSHPTMGRPLGRYQVMEANLPQWSQRAVGRTVSPDEFLSSPHLQNEIFDHRFGGYVEKYGPLGAARAWFAGEGGMNDYKRTDRRSLELAGQKGGTSVGQYETKFAKALKREMKNTPNTVETVPTSVRDVGVPGAMAAIGKGVAAGGASLSASANAAGIGRGGEFQGLNLPPVGFEGGVGAPAARGSASMDLSGINMGSVMANAGLRAGAGAGMGGGSLGDMFAGRQSDPFEGTWVGKTPMDDETLMAVIGGSSAFGEHEGIPRRRGKLLLKNTQYGLL